MQDKFLRGPKQILPNEYFGKLLYEQLLNGGTRIAIIDAITGKESTYHEILNRSISLANHLKKMGLTNNDFISICSENNLYCNIPIIAALFLGIPIAPINNNYTYREFLHVFNFSKPKIVFCTTQVLENIIKVSKEIKSIKKIIILNKCEKLQQPNIQHIEEFINEPISLFQVDLLNNENVAAVLCSSGTTGLPKGVMLSYKNFLAGYSWIKDPKYGSYSSDKIGLALVPFFHVYGLLLQLYMLMTNMKIILLTKFEGDLFLNAIEKYKVTMITLIPPLMIFLAKSPLVDNYDLSSLKEIICGAGPLNKDTQEDLIKRLNVIIRQGYGQTELTIAVAIQPAKNINTGTVGTLVPGMCCKIIDPETGRTLGPYQNGELCFKGTLVMKGYIGDKKATDETIDTNGWLHSGDIGYYDNKEYLFVVERLKELIKFKGYQVPPAELENLLLLHPGIMDCGVVGKFDKESGEELATAFVVKKPNSTIKESDVIKFVADNISYHKRLHGGVIFVDIIPKNLTGKILRRFLRDKLNPPPSKL